MSGDEETPSSGSPILKLLKSIKQVVLSKASPIADAVLFFFLVFLLSVAGHTFQDVYGTNQLVQSFRHRLLLSTLRKFTVTRMFGTSYKTTWGTSCMPTTSTTEGRFLLTNRAW